MQFDDSKPIWAQLVDQFRTRIASGTWQPGARIPSVRELALEYGTNPNTMQKALTEIDRLGLTTTERGSGRFVAADAEAISAARLALAQAATDTYIAAVTGIGMTPAEAADLLRQRWEQRHTTPTDTQEQS